jgi:uncharacterized protein (TIGR03083 family)
VTSIRDRYLDASRSFIDLAGGLTPDEWATPVPCNPGWTARDVLSHVSGIPDDAIAGRMDGVASEPWTASQVERNAGFSVRELLDRWGEQREFFAEAIDAMGEHRPPFDCHAHEHDVRQAIGRPGNRDSRIVRECAEALLGNLAALPISLSVAFHDGSVIDAGAGGPAIALTTSRFEVFRSMLGRRSVHQVRALDWSGDADAIETAVGGWFTFGPSDLEIIE